MLNGACLSSFHFKRKYNINKRAIDKIARLLFFRRIKSKFVESFSNKLTTTRLYSNP